MATPSETASREREPESPGFVAGIGVSAAGLDAFEQFFTASTNEELETSKQELQSLNAELNAVNKQHQDKIEKLEREVVEIASLEQQSIGQDLHDSVGQELTALNLLAKDLAEIHQTDPAKSAPLIGQIIQGLQRCQLELRTVLRGLLPVPIDSEGLMAALAELAGQIQRDSKVVCAFDCPQKVSVADNRTATHLYLITREAIYNAVKHAQARNIRISLVSNPKLILSVQDDGTGMLPQAVRPVATAAGGTGASGLGLRVMRNRAASIGAELTIEPAKPSGTVVTCVLARKNNESQTNQETSPHPDR